MAMRYGYPMDIWDKAKEEMRQVLIGRCKLTHVISYSELTQQVKTIVFEPDSYGFHAMLGEISSDEDAAGRGMLSAIVVHKDDQRPGGGFYELAQQLGYDTSDHEICWIGQLNKVYRHWA